MVQSYKHKHFSHHQHTFQSITRIGYLAHWLLMATAVGVCFVLTLAANKSLSLWSGTRS